MSFCSVGVAVSALWPVATNRIWLLNRAEQPSTMFWTASAFWLSSPMYCCISSSTTRVRGSLPSVVERKRSTCSIARNMSSSLMSLVVGGY